MTIPALGLLAVCLFAGPARADLEYVFNVTSPSHTLQPFSFSFTSPTFLADNDVPTFTPFTLTSGADSWTLTKGLGTQNGNGCFEFGTPTGIMDNCNVASDGSDQSAALLLELFSPLPTSPGVYDLAFGAFVWDSSAVLDLTGSLDITFLATVPEPASIGLFVIVLALIGWKLNRRYAHVNCDAKL